MKKLLMIPSDLSLLFTGGAIIPNKLNNIAMADINCSIPLVNEAIVTSTLKSHLTSDSEQTKTTLKNDMVSSAKNILIDIGAEENKISEILLLTDETALLDYLANNNKLIYLASTASLLTNNVIDMYYHTVDKCIYVSPELSQLGTPILFNGVTIEIDLYRVAPLQLESTLTSTLFKGDTRYYPDMEFKHLDLSQGLAKAKTDVTAYAMLLQGLSHYTLKSEYTRITEKNGQANNVFTDNPIHIIVLNEPAENLLEDNSQVRQGLIIQATPSEWRLKSTGRCNINNIAFPIRF